MASKRKFSFEFEDGEPSPQASEETGQVDEEAAARDAQADLGSKKKSRVAWVNQKRPDDEPFDVFSDGKKIGRDLHDRPFDTWARAHLTVAQEADILSVHDTPPDDIWVNSRYEVWIWWVHNDRVPEEMRVDASKHQAA